MSWQFSGRKWVNAGDRQLRQVAAAVIGAVNWFVAPAIGMISGIAALSWVSVADRGLVGGEGDDTRGADERLVEGEQERQLDQERQAAAELVDAVLPIERHRLFRDLLAIALVLPLQLAHEGLHPLHLLLRADLGVEERRDEEADDDGEDDDREREVAEQVRVERDQEVEEREEEDVPGRCEVLDPEEAGGEDGGHDRDQPRLLHGVVAARVERVAAGDAAHAHGRATQQAIALDRLVRVMRAARGVAAGRRHPEGELLVRDDQSQPDLPHLPKSDRSRSVAKAARSSA